MVSLYSIKEKNQFG